MKNNLNLIARQSEIFSNNLASMPAELSASQIVKTFAQKVLAENVSGRKNANNS